MAFYMMIMYNTFGHTVVTKLSTQVNVVKKVYVAFQLISFLLIVI